MIPRYIHSLRHGLAVLPLLVSCSGDTGGPPNVLIISLDTLRADHLSCYGYAKQTTPRLDRLASTATRYTDCMATAPWTVPSHASLMTGRFPSEHGAISFDIKPGPGMESWQVDNAQPLGPENITLAEVLRDDGYATAGFVANTTYLR
ncbi:MAG: arylsulfatase A-like enzyme, partial [Planctomycetota bacterium]